MADERPADERPADDPALATAARHALHDEELVAAFAAGDDEADASRARSLIERCAMCSELARDVASIASAVRALDDAAAASTYVKAPRDFRLTPEGGERARPKGVLARLASAFGGMAAIARPVGATLATFGLVGLLVGTVSLGPLAGSPAMAPGPAFGTSAPRAVDQGGGPGSAPEATEDGRNEYQPLSSSGDPELGPTSPEVGGPEPATVSWLFAGSMTALVLGAALLWAGSSRRRASGEPGR